MVVTSIFSFSYIVFFPIKVINNFLNHINQLSAKYTQYIFLFNNNTKIITNS